MKEYLYDNFIDGFLHIMVLFCPLVLTIFTQIANGATGSAFISLFFSIISSLYATGKKYNNVTYYRVKRIRISLLIIIIALCISLCYTGIILMVRYLFDDIPDCFFLDYSLPYSIYAFSNIPYFIEWLRIMIDDVRKGDDELPPNVAKLKFDCDLRSANIN